jgi:hypothetical protein
MSQTLDEGRLATALGGIAVLGMLISIFGAGSYQEGLRSVWGQDGLQHLEIVEVLPYYFWCAVWFGVLVGRRQVALALCNGYCLCGAVAGAILGRLLFRAAAGDLTVDHSPQWLSSAPVDAASSVLTWLFILMGVVGGVALVWQLSSRSPRCMVLPRR